MKLQKKSDKRVWLQQKSREQMKFMIFITIVVVFIFCESLDNNLYIEVRIEK